MSIKDLIYKANSKLMEYDFIALSLFYLLPPFKYLFGKQYALMYKSISFKNEMDKEKLFTFINKAQNTTPYYRKSNPKQISSLKEFEQFFTPIDKTVVVNQFKDFISSDYSRSHFDLVATGGTSGHTGKFYVSKSRYKKEFAFYHKIWSTKGYNNDLRAVIRRDVLHDKKIYKINPLTKQVIFDGFRDNDEYYQSIYQTILKFKIKYLEGYPFSIHCFFVFLNKQQYDLSFIKGVFLSSEVFLEYQRNFLIDQLKLPVLSVYGHSEKLALAVDVDGNDLYHVLEDYGYIELLDSNGHTIKKVNELGEIVATTLDNHGMPLIRYRTGDYSSYHKYSETEARILNGIQGKRDGLKIYKLDGSYITTVSLLLDSKLNSCMDGLQYIQREKGELIVQVIPNDHYDDRTEALLYNHYLQRMGENAKIIIQKVSTLKRKPNGKFLILESCL